MLTSLGLKVQYCPRVLTFGFGLIAELVAIAPSVVGSEVFVELHHEVVMEILRHPSTVIARITYNLALLREYFHHRAFEVSINK